MKDWLKKIFRRRKERPEAQPLCIEGTHTTITAEPDDAEMAAEALLASLASEERRVKSEESKSAAEPQPAEKGTAAYYRQLASRIEKAHADAARRTLRFVAFCEQELRKPVLPKEGPSSLALLEAELYKRIDTVEREGGELKRRWQHCLADVTVRLMEEVKSEE